MSQKKKNNVWWTDCVLSLHINTLPHIQHGWPDDVVDITSHLSNGEMRVWILLGKCNFSFISEMCWKPLVMCIYIFLSVIFSIWIYFKKCVLCIASVIETLPHSCIFLFIIDQSWYCQLHQTTRMKWFPFCGSVPHIKPKVCMVFEHYSLVKC